jgi:hypothetical protein
LHIKSFQLFFLNLFYIYHKKELFSTIFSGFFLFWCVKFFYICGMGKLSRLVKAERRVLLADLDNFTLLYNEIASGGAWEVFLYFDGDVYVFALN